MTKFWYFIIVIFLLLFVFDDVWKDKPALEFMKTTEERLDCNEDVSILSTEDLTKSNKGIKPLKIEYNIVQFPLDKKEVMVEFCATYANYSSEMKDDRFWFRVLDKDGNTLAEKEGWIFDIPGGRKKKTAGAMFIDATLAQEITNVEVSQRR